MVFIVIINAHGPNNMQVVPNMQSYDHQFINQNQTVSKLIRDR